MQEGIMVPFNNFIIEFTKRERGDVEAIGKRDTLVLMRKSQSWWSVRKVQVNVIKLSQVL